MDNRNLYEYTFSELTSMVVLSRETLLEHHKPIEKSIGKIFDFGEGEFSTYKTMVEANESRAIKMVEALIVKMCEQNNIPFEYYPIDPQYINCSLCNQAKSRPFQIIRIENAKRVGYVFCDFTEIEGYVSSFKKGAYIVDSIKIVAVNSPDKDAYKVFYEEPNKLYAETGISVRIITLEELFDDFFGKDEYPVFVDYVNKFNIWAKEVIGFNTVLAPTKAAIERFRVKTGEFLVAYPYKDFIPADIYQSQVNILLDNYLDRELWRAMIGKADFAVSFISSEWNYHVYQLTENLDMTGVVAGYLKSIEQLLFHIFSISEDKGISIKSRDGRIVDFALENESCIDSTLGSLESAIQHNGHILDVSPYMKRYLVDTIAEWRNDQRNGYFHKHNLCLVEKVEEIRNKAVYLCFLILGSCSIQDDQFAKLGIETASENNDFSYDKFVSWIESILNYGLPKDTVAVCLMLYDTEENLWALQLHGLSTFDKNAAFYKWSDNFNSGHNAYKWDRKLPESDAVHMVAKTVQEYMKTGELKDNLAAYQEVAVACRYHTEFPYEKSN